MTDSHLWESEKNVELHFIQEGNPPIITIAIMIIHFTEVWFSN